VRERERDPSDRLAKAGRDVKLLAVHSRGLVVLKLFEREQEAEQEADPRKMLTTTP
jgi:hypothetical protein